MHRQIAGKLTGRVTKWLALGVWVLLVVVAGPLAGKLTDVQDNQASSWLPASAESTRALEKLAPFHNQNDIPTVLGATLVITIFTVAGCLLADILYAIADPRIRLGSSS